MNNWRDLRQVQATLTPTDKRPPDHNLYCYRPNGGLYVVVPPSKWKRLRGLGKLDSLSKAIRADIQCKQEQTMPTAKVVQIGSEGELAFRRLEPILDRMRQITAGAKLEVAKEYDALKSHSERATFEHLMYEKYGYSKKRLLALARVGREFPARKKILQRNAGIPIDETNIEVMRCIVDMKDDELRLAAKAGLFKAAVSKRDIITYRQTGKLPTKFVKHVTKTELQKIQSLMADAKSHIDRASLRVADITAIMEDNDIANAKGKEATALISSFEKLCTKMATANPVTSKRAFQILRGEA